MEQKCPLCPGFLDENRQCTLCKKICVDPALPMSSEEKTGNSVLAVCIHLLYAIFALSALVKFGLWGLVSVGLTVALLIFIARRSYAYSLAAAVLLVPIAVLIASALSEITRDRHDAPPAYVAPTTPLPPLLDPVETSPATATSIAPVVAQPAQAEIKVAPPVEQKTEWRALSAREADAIFENRIPSEASRPAPQRQPQTPTEAPKPEPKWDAYSGWEAADGGDPAKRVQP